MWDRRIGILPWHIVFSPLFVLCLVPGIICFIAGVIEIKERISSVGCSLLLFLNSESFLWFLFGFEVC